MEKKIISKSNNIRKGMLDDDYTLFDDGSVLHEYDDNIYPNGINKRRNLRAESLSEEVKQRLLDSSSEENKEITKQLLGLS